MPRPPVTTVTVTMTPAMIQSRFRSGVPLSGNSAESNTVRMRTGFTTPRPAVTKMRAPTAETLAL